MRFIARAPIVVEGRDYRPGDSFDADMANVQAHVERGHAEALEVPEVKASKKRAAE